MLASYKMCLYELILYGMVVNFRGDLIFMYFITFVICDNL